MSDLEQRYAAVIRRINETSRNLNRPVPDLLAVSKKHPATAIRTLYGLGQRRFGESYWQEAEEKMQQLNDLDIEWHYIGPLQSNKTRVIAEHFDWVQSLEREKIAQRLNDQRPIQQPPLKVCLQVNIDNEDSKSGIASQQLLPLARAVLEMPRLSLQGLMCIPKASNDPQQQLSAFQRLAHLRQQLLAELPAGSEIPTLSMGMSGDLEAAIEAGSTLLRIGTALFGSRQKNVTNPS